MSLLVRMLYQKFLYACEYRSMILPWIASKADLQAQHLDCMASLHEAASPFGRWTQDLPAEANTLSLFNGPCHCTMSGQTCAYCRSSMAQGMPR